MDKGDEWGIGLMGIDGAAVVDAGAWRLGWIPACAGMTVWGGGMMVWGGGMMVLGEGGMTVWGGWNGGWGLGAGVV